MTNSNATKKTISKNIYFHKLAILITNFYNIKKTISKKYLFSQLTILTTNFYNNIVYFKINI